jgi:opacity protein-like surface antigen
VTRRLSLLPLAIIASLSVLIAACASAPSAPVLTDPKEILTQSVVSVNNVKTLEFTGTFSGSVAAAQLGNFDLSTIKMSGSLDIPNKKAKFTLDAPTLLGTKIDALLLDQAAYLKIAGPFAAMAHAQSDKYTKTTIPESSSNPTDVAKTVSDVKAALDKLPTPPVKDADEKCGDQDCYHVTLKVSAADLKTLDSTSTLNGDVTVDIWSHKSDYRPAKITFGVATTDLGTFSMTMEIKYDVSVAVDAPPADQVVNP